LAGVVGEERVEFGVLGPLRVVSDGHEVALTARRQRTLVASLLLRRGSAASADVLIESVWGEEVPASAASVLRLYVSQVRRLLPPGRLVRSQSGYALLVEPGELDLDVFEQLAARGVKALADGNAELAVALHAQALALWRGPALADLADEPFALVEARRLDELRLQTLETWAEASLALGRNDEVLAELQRAVAEEPLREGLRRLLMLSLYRDDRQAEALAVYQDGRRRLVDELGLEPSDELRGLERRIHRRDPSLLLHGDAIAKPAGSPVPLPTTVTVGRDAELDALERRLLASPRSLVTLVGTSGIGKTRLALETAARLERSFANGVFFVELAALADADLVLPALGAALGVREQADEGWPELLAARVGPLQALVVLDNFEHLLEAAPAVSALLRNAPELRILVTSTTVLHVAGEVVVPVPPLGADEARTLFVRQALAAGASAADGEPAGEIDEICARLEGSPLAIELAAPWLRTLSPADLLQRLGERLALGGGPRDAAERHRSLRAAIAWSVELLPSRERGVFLQLVPFAGGFDLDAFDSVVDPPSVDALAALVDASMAQAAEGRYRLLESVREYAAEQVGDDNPAWLRHASHYTEVAETAERELAGGDQAQWLARLDGEHVNFRAALDRLGERGEPLAELRLAAALGRYWYLRGHIAEGTARLGHALERTAELVEPLRAKALRLRSALALIRGDYPLARSLAEAALSLNRELDDAEGIARTLSNLGAILHAQGDLAGAATTLDECIGRCFELGDSRLLALAENNRGDVALSQGDLRVARVHFERSLAVMRELADTANIARALYNVGAVALEEHELDKAGECFAESIELAREVGDREDVAWCMIGAATLACARERFDEAARLVAFIDVWLESFGAAMKPFEQRLYDRTRETLAARRDGTREPGDGLVEAEAVELAQAIASGR
jgi:predicted ATPase/DNA-binding SARP family transcriptional activator